jgi:hypothetical protein
MLRCLSSSSVAAILMLDNDLAPINIPGEHETHYRHSAAHHQRRIISFLMNLAVNSDHFQDLVILQQHPSHASDGLTGRKFLGSGNLFLLPFLSVLW